MEESDRLGMQLFCSPTSGSNNEVRAQLCPYEPNAMSKYAGERAICLHMRCSKPRGETSQGSPRLKMPTESKL